MNTLWIRKEKNNFIVFEKSIRKYNFFKNQADLDQFLNSESFCIERYIDNSLLSNNELSAPLAAYLEISSKCNLKCKHCFKPNSQIYTLCLNLDKMKNIVDQLYDLGVFEIRLVGYEPTCSDYFFEIVNYIKEKGFFLVLNTNAYYNDEIQLNITNLLFDCILISLEGTFNFHDSIRGKGSFNKVIAMISKIADKSKIRLNVTISKDNIQSMNQLVDLADKLGVLIGFTPYRNIGYGRRNKTCSQLKSLEMKEIAEEIDYLRKKYTKTKIILAYHDILTESINTYHPLHFAIPCPGSNNISILNNGQVFHCDFLSYIGDLYCGGNVLEKSIIDIWNSKYLENYRNIKVNDNCLSCNLYRTRCSGGCASEVLDKMNIYFDPLCFNKELIQQDLSKFKRTALYDEDYFINGLKTNKSFYSNYHWIEDRSINEALSLIDLLGIEKEDYIIDFGAGFGFLVKAFCELGYKCNGFEVSEYAISQAKESGVYLMHSNALHNIDNNINYIISRNCFEHLLLEEIDEVLSVFSRTHAMLFFSVPLTKYDGGDYIISSANLDITHNLRRSKEWWINKLGCFYKYVQVYHNIKGIDENYKDYSEAIGYFVCTQVSDYILNGI